MTTTGPTLLQFPTPDYLDPVKALRNLADDIEAGRFGDVTTCAVALMANTMEVFSSGTDSNGPATALLFNAAAHRFTRAIEGFGQ